MAEFYDIKDELTVADSCLCFLTPGAVVLEVGSATGYATRYMTEKLNCTVSCIEKSPAMAALGKRYAKKMIVADLEADNWESELENDRFDYIMFADVLEHLQNPSDVLRRIKPFLKENGYILSSIPNIGHASIIIGLRNGVFDYREKGLLDNTHIYFMTRKSIHSIFNQNGLYCAAEENRMIRPCDTEFEYFYCLNPLLALSVISKRDAHVYRFVQKWSVNKIENLVENKGNKLNLFARIYELFYDLLCFIRRRTGVKTPALITGIFHHPAEKKEKKRYEKYQSKD
jgi:2-polyprenyl-3-methyl-5-hydroxy-6-metoxy-1,4-benzoquinol methylase